MCTVQRAEQQRNATRLVALELQQEVEVLTEEP